MSEEMSIPLKSFTGVTSNFEEKENRSGTIEHRLKRVEEKVDEALAQNVKLELKLDTIMNNQASILALLRKATSTNMVKSFVFPINDDDELKMANQEFGGNIDKYVADIKQIINPEGMAANFHRLFGLNIILQYNYDGVNGKKAFKDFKSINLALFDAAKKDGFTEKEYIKEIRHSFKTQKNKYFKQQYDKKKKENKSS